MRRTALVTILLAAATAAPAHALSSSRIIKRVNAERAKLGMLPLAEKRSWSRACSNHDHWMARNNTIGHYETKGTPGYTKSGAWAARHAIVSYGYHWKHGNPWRTGPMHLSLMLDPHLATAGADESGKYNCFVTAGFDRDRYEAAPDAPLADHIFTDPFDGGATGYAELAFESPFTPQERVGISYRHTTGPYLTVYALTESPPGGLKTTDRNALDRLIGGSLRETAGGKRVRIKVIDRQLGGEIASGVGFLLPVNPLKKHTRYTATARLAAPNGRQVKHTWTFRTSRRKLR